MADAEATPTPTADATSAPDKGASDSKGAENAAAPPAGTAKPAEGDKQAEGWWSSIPDENVRKHAKRYSSPADAAIAEYKARQQLSNAIKPLGEKATPEEIADFRRKMGVPLKPEGYKLAGIEGKEPTDIEKAFQGEMAKAFYEASIPEGAARKLNQKYNEFVAEFQRSVSENDRADYESWQTALSAKWGSDMAANVAAGKKALSVAAEETGNEKIAELANLVVDVGGKKMVLGNVPLFAELSAFWGRRLMEGKPHELAGSDESKSTKSELESLYALHRSSKREDQDKYRHPDTQKRIRELEALFPRKSRTKAA